MLSRVVLILAVLGVAAPASAQEPETRAETLRREREAKSEELKPYEQGRLERTLLRLENGRIIERVLNPPEGIYPKIGTITPGSGFAAGPAYRRPGLFNGHADFSALAVGSIKKYWMLDARLKMPSLAGGRVFTDIHAQRYDFPQEDFFGLGPDSRREDFATFGLQNSAIGASAGIHVTPWLAFGGGVDRLTPSISSGTQARSVETVFDSAQLPGFAEQPDFLRYEAFADLNYREPRGNPRRGGQYTFTYRQFDDRDLNRYSFRRTEVDLQQYVPFFNERRVLAFRALASVSDADGDQQVVARRRRA